MSIPVVELVAAKFAQSSLGAMLNKTFRRLALSDFDHGVDAGVVRAEQLKEMVSLTPWLMAGATINCGILVWHFSSGANATVMAVWGLALVGFIGLTVSKWWTGLNRPARKTASKRAMWRAVRHSTLLGCFWGALALVAASTNDVGDIALVTITIVGMAASGAFALAVVPGAAIAHLTAIIIPLIGSMLVANSPMPGVLAILLLNYFLVLSVIIFARNREFAHRIRDRFQVEQQAGTISVLLKDFESSSSDWLWETDINGKLTYVGDRLEEVSRLEKEQLIGRSISVVAGSAQNDNQWQAILDDIRSGDVMRESVVPARHGFKEYWWALTGSPVRDQDDHIVGYRGVGSDITERVAAQVLLEQKNVMLTTFNTRLEAEVSLRTKEAEAAVEEARQASEVKSAFLANMSHEIRTPMNGVLGMADLLTRTNLSSHQRRLVTTIDQSAQTLLTIINDILDLSRIESGKLDLDEREFELRPCIESAVELLSDEAYKKNIELNLFLPANVPARVVGDTGRLRQILVNLIGNAVKFTKQGEVVVRVSECGERDGKARLKFEISDTGIGIDKATQERLFTPFSQADHSIRRRFGGTGLGLSIVRTLVEMMGGAVSLESEPGKGTTVTFEVALAAGREQVVAAGQLESLSGKRILVVDDRATNREIVCNYLTDCNADTLTAASAEEALTALRASLVDGKPVSLAILDMIMPGIDGLELARRIKADADLSPTHLVMVTSLSWKGDSRTVREAGVREFLSKPIRRKDLLDSVQRAVSPQSSDEDAKRDVRAEAELLSSTWRGPEEIRGLKILIAEDNLVNQEVAREYARALGCDCTVADNGVLAVKAYSEATFDIVLMDCQMPEMDGLTACRKIREIERARGSKRTPIIAVTANAYDSDRKQCIEAGMDDFMGKPFTEPQLGEMLMKWRSQDHTSVEVADQNGTSTAGEEPMAQLATLELNALGSFEASRPGSGARLTELFLLTAPKSVRKVMMAVVDSDHDLLRATAHGLKSSAGNVGAAKLQALASEIEAKARDGAAMDDILTIAIRCEAEMRAVEDALMDAPWMKGKNRSVG